MFYIDEHGTFRIQMGLNDNVVLTNEFPKFCRFNII